ncbi:MAG: DUF1559 domain-containing protein [Planctomycetota bacterium]
MNQQVRNGVRSRCHLQTSCAVRRRGFTLIDVLVSLGVIAVLIVIMVPSLTAVRTTARKVMCASNARQIGLGIHMYADDFRDRLPSSNAKLLEDHPFSPVANTGYSDALTIRMAQADPQNIAGEWDGLGLLFDEGYLSAGEVFFCPSHPDEHTFDRYAPLFGANAELPEGVVASITSNYQFRGEGPQGEVDLFLMPFESAIVSDALGLQDWVNHEAGVNVLRAGLSVDWIGAAEGVTGDVLLSIASGTGSGSADDLWRTLDDATPGRETHIDDEHTSN